MANGSGSGSTSASTGIVLTSLDGTTAPKLDQASPTGPDCTLTGDCDAIDILFVIDNSGSMREELLDVSRNFPRLIDEITGLQGQDGDLIDPSVNLMVTTTDVGHPLCTPLRKPGYQPRRGAPVRDGCNARIERFTSLDPMDAVTLEEACTCRSRPTCVPRR